MTNLEKYKAAFVEGLEVAEDEIEKATAETVEKWDSIGQMTLIAILEETFNIELGPADIIEINSYEKGIDILRKYGVEI